MAVPVSAPANAASLRGPDLTRSIDPKKFEQLIPNLDTRANGQLRLFYLAIGTDDALITTHNAVKRLLTEKGVKYRGTGYPCQVLLKNCTFSDNLNRKQRHERPTVRKRLKALIHLARPPVRHHVGHSGEAGPPLRVIFKIIICVSWPRVSTRCWF